MTDREPRTEAGRSMYRWFRGNDGPPQNRLDHSTLNRILAIEAEAAAPPPATVPPEAQVCYCGDPNAEHRGPLRHPPATVPDEGLLPTFEIGQVTGALLPGRRRHDWCSVHGELDPNESIDGHARSAHGSSSDAIRKARKVLKRARAALSATKAQEP